VAACCMNANAAHERAADSAILLYMVAATVRCTLVQSKHTVPSKHAYLPAEAASTASNLDDATSGGGKKHRSGNGTACRRPYPKP